MDVTSATPAHTAKLRVVREFGRSHLRETNLWMASARSKCAALTRPQSLNHQNLFRRVFRCHSLQISAIVVAASCLGIVLSTGNRLRLGKIITQHYLQLAPDRFSFTRAVKLQSFVPNFGNTGSTALARSCGRMPGANRHTARNTQKARR